MSNDNVVIKPSNGRKYNIDLLKIVLAIMIVMNHSIGHGIKNIDYSIYENNKIMLDIIWSFTNPAVNIFFLISGYFGIKRTKKSGLTLLDNMLIIGFILGMISLFLGTMGLIDLIKSIVFPWSSWWFMTAYMIIWVLSPYINFSIETLSDNQLRKFIITLLLITLLQGFVFNGFLWGDGFSFSHCVTMYMVGRYLSRLDISIIPKKRFLIFIYIITTVLECTLYELGLSMNASGIVERISSYACPIVIAQSLSLFLFFSKCDIKLIDNIGKGKIFSLLKSSVLIVYLITDFGGIKKYIYIPLVKVIDLTGMVFTSILIYAIISLIAVVPICTTLNYITNGIYHSFIEHSR